MQYFQVALNLCVGMTSLLLVIFGISINLFIAISADRYWAVCRPNSYYKLKNSRHTVRMVSLSFFLGILSGSIPIMWNEENRHACAVTCDITCVSTKLFMELCCLWIFISIAIISVLYALIYRAIKRNVSKISCLGKILMKFY